MDLLLKRNQPTDVSTIGELFVDGEKQCTILEDPVREEYTEEGEWRWDASMKIPGETAIPSGRYQIIITYSPKFGGYRPLLLNVPDYTGVRIHRGNWPKDTEGCLLPGTTPGEDAVWSSGVAYDDLYEKIKEALLAGEDVFITIENCFDG